jgi:hypothetical protein
MRSRPLGWAAPTPHVRGDGRDCPMRVDAAPEARSMAAQWLVKG